MRRSLVERPVRLVLTVLALTACAPVGSARPRAAATAEILTLTPAAAQVAVATVPPTPSPAATQVATATPPPPPSPAATALPATPEAPPPAEVALAESRAPEERLVAGVNELRVQSGLAPYRLEPGLSDVARSHSCDLAAHGAISHTSSDGRTLHDRLGEQAGRWSWPSESIAVGTDDATQVIAMWLDEPPDGWHRRNLLDPEQQVMGVGYCVAPDDPSGQRHYWTLIVTRPAT